MRRAFLAICPMVVALPALLSAAPPALAQGAVPELRFRDIFRLPIGPRGLEPTPALLALAGQRVRMVGYMAQQHAGTGAPGSFILAPLPVVLDDEDEALADDLPPTAVHVHLPPSQARQRPAHVPGLLALVGRLDVGAFDEADGRRSFVRLQLDDTDTPMKEIPLAPPR